MGQVNRLFFSEDTYVERVSLIPRTRVSCVVVDLRGE